MKGWPWQKIVGKFILLGIAILQGVLQIFEITTWGWAPALITFGTWVAQFLLGLVKTTP